MLYQGNIPYNSREWVVSDGKRELRFDNRKDAEAAGLRLAEKEKMQ